MGPMGPMMPNGPMPHNRMAGPPSTQHMPIVSRSGPSKPLFPAAAQVKVIQYFFFTFNLTARSKLFQFK